MPRGAPVLTGKSRIASGRRDSFVTIQTKTNGTSTSGVPVEKWVDAPPDELMNRLEIRADERYAANQTSAFVETIWQMPYREDMDPDLVDVPNVRRLVYAGRVFDIRSASPMGRKTGIELHTLASSRLPAVVS